MATYEDIKKANESIKPTDIGRGKEYVEVNKRVIAFRMVYPGGTIDTDIISLENGICVMKSTCADENGNILGTGHAYEKENSSFINKTSYIENCETSAVGRALGMAGFGIDASICSAEEIQTATLNQELDEQISTAEAELIKQTLEDTESDVTAFLKMIRDRYGRDVGSVDEMNRREYGFAMAMLKKKVDKLGKGGKKK